MDRRGYLYDGGSHVTRHQVWLAVEAEEMARANRLAAEAAERRALHVS